MKILLLAALFMLGTTGVKAQGDDYNYTNPNADKGATSEVDWVRLLEPYWPESTITFYMGNVRFHFGNRLVKGDKDEKTPGFQFDDLSPDYADLHGVFRFFGSFYDAFCR